MGQPRSRGARLDRTQRHARPGVNKEVTLTRISPWLSVGDVEKAIAFYEAAFGAVESNEDRLEDDAGDAIIVHLSVGGPGGPDFWVQHDPPARPRNAGGGEIRMILSVDDPDAVFTKAIAAGATEIAPMYEGHGWRIGRIADPAGHHWEIGKPL